MKDYFDLNALARAGVSNVSELREAIMATFARRGTPMLNSWPIGLRDEFAHDSTKRAQWSAFLAKNRLMAPALDEVIQNIRRLLEEALAAG